VGSRRGRTWRSEGGRIGGGNKRGGGMEGWRGEILPHWRVWWGWGSWESSAVK
jgi:hypothetical protein